MKPPVDGSKPVGNDEPSTTSEDTEENAILLCLLFSLVSSDESFEPSVEISAEWLVSSDETAEALADCSTEIAVSSEVSAANLDEASDEIAALIERTCDATAESFVASTELMNETTSANESLSADEPARIASIRAFSVETSPENLVSSDWSPAALATSSDESLV